jgi:hypothetical protein
MSFPSAIFFGLDACGALVVVGVASDELQLHGVFKGDELLEEAVRAERERVRHEARSPAQLLKLHEASLEGA